MSRETGVMEMVVVLVLEYLRVDCIMRTLRYRSAFGLYSLSDCGSFLEILQRHPCGTCIAEALYSDQRIP